MKQIGSCILAIRAFISELVCQAALSRRMVVVSSQPGDSRSSCSISLRMNNIMTSESVFAYVNENQSWPPVSRAAISESRGATCLSVTVAGAPEGTHTRRVNRVPFSQL